MKLSFSNLAWSAEQNDNMCEFLSARGFTGLEVAPTKIFSENPYDRIKEARIFANILKKKYGLSVSSMQSIWYGRTENIFASKNECDTLIEYTKKAVDFAAVVDCGNLVFGCPKNRNIPDGANIQIAYDFFNKITSYAKKLGTTIALEPNPPIYGTNFINSTEEAFSFAKRINGLMVNIDCGTIIENGEDLRAITKNIDLINHVHISEPNLVQIKERAVHQELCRILKTSGYDRFVSVEMKSLERIESVKEAAEYIGRVFA